LWAGGILIFAVERTNLWRRMSIQQYAVDFRRSLYRVDPLLPILGVISCVGSVSFAIGSSGIAAALAWSGAALIVLVVVGSVAIAEPINSRFRRLPEGQVPEQAERDRITWRRFHTARCIAAIAGLACLAAAAAT
jgi:hypothetical protein